MIGDIGMVHGTSLMTQKKMRDTASQIHAASVTFPNINHPFQAAHMVQPRGLCPLTPAACVAGALQPILNQKNMPQPRNHRVKTRHIRSAMLRTEPSSSTWVSMLSGPRLAHIYIYIFIIDIYIYMIYY